ncbi:MAG: hypothetical protein ACXVFF_07575 [Gaiellaceae bacterium]
MRRHPDRVSIELALAASALALGGILLGFFVVAPNHWERAADLALLGAGVLCVTFGLYVFAQFYWTWLPGLPEPRLRRSQVPQDSDEQLVARARDAVKKLGLLWGQHARYTPDRWSETEEQPDTSHAAWAKQINTSRRHEQNTLGRFFEDHYPDVVDIASELHVRRALTDDEIQKFNWVIGTSAMSGSLHGVSDIGPLLLTGAQRLRTGDGSKDA